MWHHRRRTDLLIACLFAAVVVLAFARRFAFLAGLLFLGVDGSSDSLENHVAVVLRSAGIDGAHQQA